MSDDFLLQERAVITPPATPGARASGRLLQAAALWALLAGAAPAQEWNVGLSTYFWTPNTTTGVQTPFGEVETELSIPDALEALNFGFMGTLTADRGPWTFVGDFLYMDLTLERNTPFGRLFSDATTDISITSVAGYALYDLYDNGTVSVGGGAGLRYMASDIDVVLHGRNRPDYPVDISDSWVDPVAVLRLTVGPGRWRGDLWLDAGGGVGSDGSDATWQAIALLTYDINERWSVSGGFRHLYVDRGNQPTPYDLTYSGPMLGVTFRF